MASKDTIAEAELRLRADKAKLAADLEAARVMFEKKMERMQQKGIVNLKVGYAHQDFADKIAAMQARGLARLTAGQSKIAGMKADASAASMSSVFDAITKSIGVATAAVVAFGSAATAALSTAVNRAADFEQAIVDAAVVLDITSKSDRGFAALTDAALEWGAKTSFTAKEAAQALEVFGQMGMNQQEAIAALGPTLASAAANTVSVADAAGFAAEMMNVYKKSAQDLEHINDVLTIVNAETAASFQDLRYAMSYAAPAGKAVGVSLEETAALVGMLSNVGVKGERAGTVLRGMFSDLVKPTKAAQEVLDKFKISVEGIDQPGRFMEVLKQLQEAGLSLEDATKLFGIQQGAPVLSLLNAIDRDGRKGVAVMDALVAKVNDVANAGATQRRAKFKQDSFWGDWEKMLGALDSALIRIGQPVADALRPTMQQITGYFDHIGQWAAANAESIRIWATQIINIITTVGSQVAKFVMGLTSLGKTTDGGDWTVTFLKGFSDILEYLDMWTADWEKMVSWLGLSFDVFAIEAANAIQAFLEATLQKAGMWAAAMALTIQQATDPKTWIVGPNPAVDAAIEALREKTVGDLIPGIRDKIDGESKVLHLLQMQKKVIEDQIKLNFQKRNGPAVAAAVAEAAPNVIRKDRQLDVEDRNREFAAVAGMVGAGMMPIMAGMMPNLDHNLFPGAFKPGGFKDNFAGIGGARGGNIVGVDREMGFAKGGFGPDAGVFRGDVPRIPAQGVAGLVGAGMMGGLGGLGALPGNAGFNLPFGKQGGGAFGALGMAMQMVGGDGAGLEAMLNAVAEGAEEGVAKGQVMGLKDYQRAIQDALLDTTKDEKSDWKTLLEIEEKTRAESEKIAKGIDALLKKKFSIFGGD